MPPLEIGIDRQRSVCSFQGPNHCQHETDPVYTSTSPMRGVEALTSFICANQYGNCSTFCIRQDLKSMEVQE